MVVIHQNIVHPGTSGSDIESTADIPAYVAKHKPSVEPMLDLLRRSAEFQRFTDEALATITTAAKSNSTALRSLTVSHAAKSSVSRRGHRWIRCRQETKAMRERPSVGASRDHVSQQVSRSSSELT